MRFHILAIALTFSLCSVAQTVAEGGVRSAIQADKQLTGCNYASYFTLFSYEQSLGQTLLTPTPEGYEPFYISTYARHGSRYLTEKYQYDDVLNVVKEANAKGRLTPVGKQLLNELTEVRRLCPNSKLGALTPIGRAQHRAIAERMCRNFPEIFNAEGHFFAQSSVVKRCVYSMNAEVAVIDSLTGLSIPQAYGRKGMQDRLAGHYTTPEMEAWRNKGFAPHNPERQQLTPYKRICKLLFTNTSHLSVKQQQSFVRQLFDLNGNMQSHDFGIDLWKYFNEGEMDSLWTIKNRHWYRLLGPSPLTGNTCPHRSKWQLQDILEDADSIVHRRTWHGGNLRFGHDTSLMPLACLMELGTCGMEIPETDIAHLDTYWRNQEIFPMAGNIQLVFYRPVQGDGDILVKALLCEREVSLPAQPVSGPYYRWTDIRTIWDNKLKKW